MSAPEHPGRLELTRYLCGGMAPGHAAAILAHCLVCEPCGARLRILIHAQGYAPAVEDQRTGRAGLLPGN